MKKTKTTTTVASTSKKGARSFNFARAKGFRSGFESRIAEELEAANVPFSFESTKFEYLKKPSKYTVDFDLPKKDGGVMHIETKGYFTGADRTKHLLVRQQNPDADIRFVFERSKTKLSSKSKTTYASWCERNGFLYADISIPQEWLDEVAQ